jgi:hypothetical protein
MKHLYIAGPYTNPDPIVNTHAALRIGTGLFERGLYVPHVPHLTLLWHMVTPKPIGHWYALDLAQMEMCNAFVRLPGESTGADKEVDHAQVLGLQFVPFGSLPPSLQATWTNRFATAAMVEAWD